MHRRDLQLRHPCPDPAKRLSPSLYCPTCERQVIELDRLTEREVRALKKRAQKGERICVRYRADEDGLIQLRPTLMRRAQAAVAVAAVATLLGGAAAADTSVPSGRKPAAARSHAAAPTPSAKKPAPQKEPARAASVKREYETIDGGI